MAGETAHLVERTKARLLVLAGDVEPRTMLRRALPDSCARIAAEIDTGRRAEGSDRDAFEHDVRELVGEQWRLEWGTRLDRFRAELLAESPELGDPVPLADGVGALLRHD